MSKVDKKIVILLIIYGLEGVAANLAHPVTPNLMNALDMPSYMFGVVFAAMAFTNFLFSPFWATMTKKISVKNILMLGCFGYALGQLIFGFSDSKLLLTLGRLIAGAFVAGIFVGIPYYIVTISDPNHRAKNITQAVTIFSVMGTVGYFIGGYIGSIDIYYPFMIQVGLLVVCGLLFKVLLEENTVEEKIKIRFKDINPLVKFTTMKNGINPIFTILFIVVLVISTASTSLSQSYSYYLASNLGLDSMINGVTKASVGFLALFVNYFITMRLVNKKKTNKYIMILFAIITSSFLVLNILGNDPYVFVSMGIIIMVMDTMQQSLLQDRYIHYSDPKNQAQVLGNYNAMKSLGMIIGALVSGWLYDILNLGPFIFAMILYFIVTLLMGYIAKDKQLG